MKYKWLILAVIIAAVFSSCGSKENNGSQPLEGENFGKDASYALGMSFGMDLSSMLASGGIVPNLDEFLQGMRDILSGGNTRLSESEAEMKIQEAFYAIMEGYDEGAESSSQASMQEGIDFLIENSRKPGVVITSSGLQYEVITAANGPKPTPADVVQVHYEGTLINGEIFDSSYQRGTPIEFPLDGVIAGWTEGLQLMSVGSKYKFYIPQELGYGSYGVGSIPPYSTLIFTVELLDIK
jgi:FKBP-type peptidyl-prolyl cis-trans isomerase